MYVVNKDKQFCTFKTNLIMTDIPTMILSNDFDPDILVVDVNLDIDVIEMYLILTGSSLFEWLETANVVIGLHPFMSMAKSNCNNVEKVYEVVMMNLNIILQRRFASRNTKRSVSKWTETKTQK